MFDVEGDLAVLNKHVLVRVLNVSASGCLLESGAFVEPGISGFLQVHVGGEEFSDEIRITRCQPVEGAGSTHHAGAQFLWATAPGNRSLRRLIGGGGRRR